MLPNPSLQRERVQTIRHKFFYEMKRGLIRCRRVCTAPTLRKYARLHTADIHTKDRRSDATTHDGREQPQLRMELASFCGVTMHGSSDDYRRLVAAEPDFAACLLRGRQRARSTAWKLLSCVEECACPSNTQSPRVLISIKSIPCLAFS